MYHQVLDLPERDKGIRNTSPAYCLSVEGFSEQMKYLVENGYRSLSLKDVIDDPARNHQKSLAITFDDGWSNNYSNAFQILKDLGLTATVFIVTDFVGKDGYMDWTQLRQMHEAGIAIQSHGVSHKPLSFLTSDDIVDELERSKKQIEDHLDSTVDFFSAPHGMTDQRVLDIARSIGYKAVCTSEPGFRHSFAQPAILKRINMSDACQISEFGKIVQANQMAILPRVLSKKMKNVTKKLLGWDNYRRIYRLRYPIGE
jgi:hypothetical protein